MSSDESQDIQTESDAENFPDDKSDNSSQSALSFAIPEPAEARVLPNRATRGTRISTLAGSDAEADEQFWTQDAWQADDDDEYIPEGDVKDKFDSDFFISESSDDEVYDEEGADRLSRAKKKKTNSKYSEPVAVHRRKTGGSQAAKFGENRPSRSALTAQVWNTPRSLRASTETKSAVSAEHRKADDHKNPLPKRVNRSAQRLLQNVLLAEAAATEIDNKRSLKLMQIMEAEKKQQPPSKRRLSETIVRYRSKLGESNNQIILFNEDSYTLIPSDTKEAPQKARCVITGLPAKYRDPQTQKPYATLEAFRVLRARHENSTC